MVLFAQRNGCGHIKTRCIAQKQRVAITHLDIYFLALVEDLTSGQELIRIAAANAKKCEEVRRNAKNEYERKAWKAWSLQSSDQEIMLLVPGRAG